LRVQGNYIEKVGDSKNTIHGRDVRNKGRLIKEKEPSLVQERHRRQQGFAGKRYLLKTQLSLVPSSRKTKEGEKGNKKKKKKVGSKFIHSEKRRNTLRERTFIKTYTEKITGQRSRPGKPGVPLGSKEKPRPDAFN